MLREYALTPQVLSPSVFESGTVYRLSLRQLVPELLHGPGVVRNLAAGTWERAALAAVGANSIEGSKFLKALLQRGTVRCHATAGGPCDAESEWIGVAQTEHLARPLRGVICSPATAAPSPLVADVTRLNQCDWWSNHPASWPLKRSAADYRGFFEPLFCYSREIMFVDQYLDTSKRNYREFVTLLQLLHHTNPLCKVSIHVSMQATALGPRPTELALTEWREPFQSVADNSGHSFELVLRSKNVAYREVRFGPHERFLICTMGILSLTNGFDTEQNSTMTAALVSRDDVRRFYERSYGSGVRSEKIHPD